MRKIMIATPAHDGLTDVFYNNSLNETIKLICRQYPNMDIFPVYLANDSLVQRARNDLVRMALYGGFHDLIFIDGDQEWDPLWIPRLLAHKVDVVGGAVVKKSDVTAYNIRVLPQDIRIDSQGLMSGPSVNVGTGFMRISNKALKAVWEASEPYINEGRWCRMVFDVRVINKELVSEDNVFCRKWIELGGKVYVDPTMTCSHIGRKKWDGNFMEFIKPMLPKPAIVLPPKPVAPVQTVATAKSFLV